MNTADRSIGLIDAALRRRFHFKALFPGEPPIKATLRKWLKSEGPAEIADHAADLVDRMNDRLMEQQGAYGENLKVGHSYFMESDLDVDLLSRIWASDVLPYLEEQLFGREVDIQGTFSLEALDNADAETAASADSAVEDETESLLDDSEAS
jgi:5-methylcytosine-specific restriction protein B